MKVPGAAKYLVSKGRSIVVESEMGADEDLVRLILLTSAISAVIHQRGGVPFSGSVVSLGSRTVAFLGASPSGKSLLAAALCGRGAKLVADDICHIGFDKDGAPHVHPGFPAIKLWRDAVLALGVDPDTLKPVRSGMKRYWFPLAGRFSSAALPLSQIFLIVLNNAGRIDITPISGIDKIEKVSRYSYHPELRDIALFNRQFMEGLLSLLKTVQVKEISRPIEPILLEELASAVLKSCS